MKKKKKIIIIVAIVLLIAVLIPILVRIWKIRQSNIYCMYLSNTMYTYILSIEGEFQYTPSKVKVIEMEIDEGQLLVDVVLYNEYHPEEPLTSEELLEEYEDFCNGTGTTEKLDAFCNFDRADGYDGHEHPLESYHNWIYTYLHETYGLDNKYQATMEQLEEAAEYAAKRWHEGLREY